MCSCRTSDYSTKRQFRQYATNNYSTVKFRASAPTRARAPPNFAVNFKFLCRSGKVWAGIEASVSSLPHVRPVSGKNAGKNAGLTWVNVVHVQSGVECLWAQIVWKISISSYRHAVYELMQCCIGSTCLVVFLCNPGYVLMCPLNFWCWHFLNRHESG